MPIPPPRARPSPAGPSRPAAARSGAGRGTAGSSAGMAPPRPARPAGANRPAVSPIKPTPQPRPGSAASARGAGASARSTPASARSTPASARSGRAPALSARAQSSREPRPTRPPPRVGGSMGNLGARSSAARPNLASIAAPNKIPGGRRNPPPKPGARAKGNGKAEGKEEGKGAEEKDARKASVMQEKGLAVRSDTPERVGEYTIVKEIPMGDASVFSGKHEATQKAVAIRLVPRVGLDDHRAEVDAELNSLLALDHPNLCALEGFVWGERHLAIVSELPMGGFMFNNVCQREPQSEKDVRKLVAGLARALAYLHEKGMVHRNVDAENVLIDIKGQPKLTNFGVKQSSLPALPVGNTHIAWDFTAPELIDEDEHTPASDMWGLGVLTYILLVGFPPLWGSNMSDFIAHLRTCEWSFPSPYCDNLTRQAKLFVSQLLKADPDARLTAKEAVEHVWVTNKVAGEKAEEKRARETMQAKPLVDNHAKLRIWNEARLFKREAKALAQQMNEKRYMHPQRAATVVQAYARGFSARSKSGAAGKAKLALKDVQSETMMTIQQTYTLSKTLGEGAFGTVMLGVHKESGEERAIKMISKRNIEQNDMALQVQEEVDIQAALNHPGLVRIFHVVDTRRHLCIVLELLHGGELFDRIVEKHHFSEKTCQGYMRQMLEALKYLHDHNIAHRDLKPENVLFESKEDDSLLKITDFGYSHLSENREWTSVVGTVDYMAPEVHEGKTYNEKVDIWSLGVIMYCMLCGCPPFRGRDDPAIRAAIIEGKYVWPRSRDNLSQEVKDFVAKLMEKDPKKRYSAEQALSDPWIRSEPPNEHLEACLLKLKKWNTLRRLRKGVVAAMAVSRLSKSASQFGKLVSDYSAKKDEKA